MAVGGRVPRLAGDRGAEAGLSCLVHDQTPPIDPDVDPLASFEGEAGVLPQVSGDVEDQSTFRVLVERPVSVKGHGSTDYLNAERSDFTTKRANGNIHLAIGDTPLWLWLVCRWRMSKDVE